MKISMIFFVQVVLVLVLSCESPVQDTKKEPEKIAAHDMWDYLDGKWEIVAPATITGTWTFNRVTGTVYDKSIQRFPGGGSQPLESTNNVKAYRQGATEILSLSEKDTPTVATNLIVQRKPQDRMVLTAIKDRSNPPKSLAPSPRSRNIVTTIELKKTP